MNPHLIEKLKEPQFATLSDSEAAAAINNLTVVVRQHVPCASIIQHATMHRYRSKLELAKSNPNHPCQAIAIDILSYIDSPKTQNVDMDLPETKQMLGALVPCGFADESAVQSLDSLANVAIRWVDHIGFGTAGDGHIKSAREIIANAIT